MNFLRGTHLLETILFFTKQLDYIWVKSFIPSQIKT